MDDQRGPKKSELLTHLDENFAKHPQSICFAKSYPISDFRPLKVETITNSDNDCETSFP